ncbi:MAG: endoglucanase [Pseudonocardiales bacterium]|nr:endoglucanase [Pseudonocardiales bacterium]
MTSLVRWLIAVLTALGVVTPVSSSVAAPLQYSSLKIVGNHFVTDGGKTVRLLGVQQQGLEYMCVYSDDVLFDSTHDAATIAAWKSWHVNTVRVPINESCWMGQFGVVARRDHYRNAVAGWVNRIRAAGIFVIVDNHVATDGSGPATDILPMADQRAVGMWRSVATRFKNVRGVAFDMYNEPNHIGWSCWRDGCRIPADTWLGNKAYTAVGMQDLVTAVRSTGARNPILAGGINWSNDNSGWWRHRPADPVGQLFVDEHVYGPLHNASAATCDAACRATLVDLHRNHHVPVLTGELGEIDCRHGYVDRYMAWADAHGIGYLGETWNATSPGGYECTSPVLLEDFDYPDPTPTPYGIGFRDHLQSIDTSPH